MTRKMSEEKAESSASSPIARGDFAIVWGADCVLLIVFESVRQDIASERADISHGCETNRAVWEGVRIRGESPAFLD